MKILLDTNILLDLLLQRERAEEAVIILNSIERGLHDGVILDISLVNIDYVSKKQKVDSRDFLKLVVKNCKIVGANNKISNDALNLDNNDFEDSLQYVCAKYENCDQIITNDKGFYNGELKTLNSVEFIDKYL